MTKSRTRYIVATKIVLSKTEKKVLTLAARSYRGEVTTFQRKEVVSRDLQAMRSLRVKGLMDFDGANTLVEFSDRTGRDTTYYVTQDHITDEGRKVAEMLS